jgi:diaminohydroxyphosphoribosylaminopyrimidine deaminase/5-amino-6-(5-phosphoribosylamino)uracil reductase
VLDRPDADAGESDSAQGWVRLLAGDASGGDPLTHRYGALVAAGSPLVIAQLGQSLDGFIASRTGDAHFVTGPEDRRHLQRLRALVDAVVVGVATVIADDCRLTVREVAGPQPARVVLDPTARAPRRARVFTDGNGPTWWLVATDAPEVAPPGDQVSVVRLPRAAADAGFAPAVVLRTLAERGLARVLVEGGGVTVSRFVAAGAIDRLWVTTAPVLVGDGVPGLRFPGRDSLAEAVRGPARRFQLGEDLCVELDLRPAPSAPNLP